MKRFLIFGLLGPVGTHLSVDLATRTAERWWSPHLPIHVVEVVPFLLCAFIDRSMKDARTWERLVVVTISAFLASGLTCAVVYGGLAAWVLGFYAPIIAAACSLLATATDTENVSLIEDE